LKQKYGAFRQKIQNRKLALSGNPVPIHDNIKVQLIEAALISEFDLQSDLKGVSQQIIFCEVDMPPGGSPRPTMTL
jgi:hypothetical protein